MCLRYAFTTVGYKLLLSRFGLRSVDEAITPRYNIAPTQSVPLVFNDSPEALVLAKWGIPAGWSGASHPLFNARVETIDRKPSFRKDFELRRCLMLADSFYEWDPGKRPFRISLKGGEPFAFAAIYADDGRRSCCMITCASNELVSNVHHRMPVLLPKGREKEWMAMAAEDAKGLLKPYPAAEMEMQELTARINSSKTDSPEVVEPKTGKGTLLQYMG